MTNGSLFSWALWVRPAGKRKWRRFGRAGSEQAAEALAARAPLGTDRLIVQGNADPNAGTRPSPTHTPQK
jgi:hypothetical protein